MNCALVWCNAEYYLFHLQSFIVCGFFSHWKISVNFRFPLFTPCNSWCCSHEKITKLNKEKFEKS